VSRKPKSSRDPSLAAERAALLGRSFPLALLKASGIADDEVAQLFDDSVLVQGAQATEAAFADARVFQKIRRSIPWSRKRDHHLALGNAALQQRLPATAVAAYFEAAHRFDLARSQWMRAGEACCARNEFAEAMRMMDRALAIWPWDEASDNRIRVLRETARCAANARMAEQARKAWQELADYACDAGLWRLRVEALDALSGFSSDPVSTGELLAEAAAIAVRELPPAEAFRHGLI
jgi:tetratricopeptide (TPR) repeat protein